MATDKQDRIDSDCFLQNPVSGLKYVRKPVLLFYISDPFLFPFYSSARRDGAPVKVLFRFSSHSRHQSEKKSVHLMASSGLSVLNFKTAMHYH